MEIVCRPGAEGGGHAVPASGAGTLWRHAGAHGHTSTAGLAGRSGLRSQRERAANARHPAQGGRVIFPAATRSLGHTPAGGLLRGIVARVVAPREWCRLGSEAATQTICPRWQAGQRPPGLFLPGLRRLGGLEPRRGPEPLEQTATEDKGGLPSPIRQQPNGGYAGSPWGAHAGENAARTQPVSRVIVRWRLPWA